MPHTVVGGLSHGDVLRAHGMTRAGASLTAPAFARGSFVPPRPQRDIRTGRPTSSIRSRVTPPSRMSRTREWAKAPMARRSAPTSFAKSWRATETRRPVELITRSEEHTSELQSLMRISYAVFRLKKKTHTPTTQPTTNPQHLPTQI